MKKKKQKAIDDPKGRVESAYPKGWKKPKALRLLSDWKATTLTIMDDDRHGHVVEYIVSPKGKIYQRAFSWQNPDLYIDCPLFHENVRLMRVKSAKRRKEVRRALRRNRSR